MQRDFERGDPRRRYRWDDDPRDDPRERFGNEEDPWSRTYRRAYAERDLPARMHDDRPYEERGYEPELGRPGQRVSEAARRTHEDDRFSNFGEGYGETYDERRRWSSGGGYDRSAGAARSGGPGRYDEPWRQGGRSGRFGAGWEPSERPASWERGRRPPFETSGEDWLDSYYDYERDRSYSPSYERPGPAESRIRHERYGQPSYGRSEGRSGGRYDQGEIGPWYGGDTGMGEAGGSGGWPGGGYRESSHRYGEYGRPEAADRRRYDRPERYGGAERYDRSGDDRPEYRERDGQPEEYGPARYGRQEGRASYDADRETDRPRGGWSGGTGGWSGGQFRGRGPRGYRRSDDRVREDVCDLLTRHGEIDASDMEVDVRDGTVILRGTVETGQIRRLTEEVVEQVPGVRDVQNELRVNRRTGYEAAGAGEWRGPSVAGYPAHSSAAMADTGTPDESSTAVRASTPAFGTGVAATSGVSTRSGAGEPGTGAGAGPSQHGNRWQIRDTMEVVGSDGEHVGKVVEVRGTDIRVERAMRPDIFIPFVEVQTVDGDRVMLRCRSGEIDEQGWPTRALTGASQAKPSQQG